MIVFARPRGGVDNWYYNMGLKCKCWKRNQVSTVEEHKRKSKDTLSKETEALTKKISI